MGNKDRREKRLWASSDWNKIQSLIQETLRPISKYYNKLEKLTKLKNYMTPRFDFDNQLEIA